MKKKFYASVMIVQTLGLCSSILAPEGNYCGDCRSFSI